MTAPVFGGLLFPYSSWYFSQRGEREREKKRDWILSIIFLSFSLFPPFCSVAVGKCFHCQCHLFLYQRRIYCVLWSHSSGHRTSWFPNGGPSKQRSILWRNHQQKCRLVSQSSCTSPFLCFVSPRQPLFRARNRVLPANRCLLKVSSACLHSLPLPLPLTPAITVRVSVLSAVYAQISSSFASIFAHAVGARAIFCSSLAVLVPNRPHPLPHHLLVASSPRQWSSPQHTAYDEK